MYRLFIIVLILAISCKKDDEPLADYYVTVKGLTYPQISHSKDFPLMAYYGVPPGFINKERFQELKDAGFNINLYYYPNLDSLESALDFSYQVGIKTIINCPELMINTEQVVEKFKNHPGNGGYYIYDEPSITAISTLNDLKNKIFNIDSTKLFYLNLLPNYASLGLYGTDTYEKYIQNYISNFQVNTISFDNYSIINGYTIRGDWYQNLETILNEAKKYNKEFWGFALATSHASFYQIPDLPQLRLQQYTNLAYGAKGLEYFTYWTPNSPGDGYNNGPIEIDGSKTPVYYRVKEVNAEIQAVSDIFLESSVTGVFQTGSIPLGTKRLGVLPPYLINLETIGNGATVSFLENDKFYALLIVNRDIQNKMVLNIRFAKNQQIFNIAKNGMMIPISDIPMRFNVNEGDAIIYKIDKK